MKPGAGILAVGVFFFAISVGWAAEKVIKKEDLPLSRADGIAYYSTGIGKESREVRIVGFPLRIDFVQGKAYLANVDVTIQDAQ